MSYFKELVNDALRGEVDRFNQRVAMEHFDKLVAEGERGQARRHLDMIQPVFDAMEAVEYSAPKFKQYWELKRETRRPPKRRRGHSKRWSSPVPDVRVGTDETDIGG